jgi:hypothetical protein
MLHGSQREQHRRASAVQKSAQARPDVSHHGAMPRGADSRTRKLGQGSATPGTTLTKLVTGT